MSWRISSSVSELDRDGDAPLRARRARPLLIAEDMPIIRPIIVDHIGIAESIAHMFQRRLQTVVIEGPADVGLELDRLRNIGFHGEIQLLAMEFLEHGGDDGRAVRSRSAYRDTSRLTAIQLVRDRDR
jgi:hypothetical protein